MQLEGRRLPVRDPHRVSDTGDEETFSRVDGSISYDLKLLGIKREALGTGTSPATPATPPKSGKALAATGAGVVATTATAAERPSRPTFAAGPAWPSQQVAPRAADRQ